MEKIKIVIAEDHLLLRKKLVEMLNTKEITVIGDVPNGKELIVFLNVQTPDIILLDLDMPKMSLKEMLKILLEDFPNIKKVVYSGYTSPGIVNHAIDHGASAYLTKDADIPVIIDAIKSVHRDEYYINEYLSALTLTSLKKNKRLPLLIGHKKFTEREIDIIRMLCDDYTIEAIAAHFRISVSGVASHKKRIFLKCNVTTIVSLVKFAIWNGIVNEPKKKT